MNNAGTVAVWDPLVRLFHWSLLGAFLTSWLTQEEQYNLHLQAGYLTLGLICFRILWGLVGTRHARFSDFIYGPRTIHDYLKSLLGGGAERFIGHNPAGGAMILALLLGLLTVTVSGIALDGAENWSGPMAEMNLYRHLELIQTTHELSTDLLLILIVLHLLGVLHASLAHRENLVLAMITGRKRAK
jgi:cytochrome b